MLRQNTIKWFLMMQFTDVRRVTIALPYNEHPSRLMVLCSGILLPIYISSCPVFSPSLIKPEQNFF